MIEVGSPFAGEADGGRVARGGRRGRARRPTSRCSTGSLHAFRLVTADPYLAPVGRHQTLVARVGYGVGEEVADGLWTEARELLVPEPRQRRKVVLRPRRGSRRCSAAAQQPLACEELTLRARLDLDQGRYREAALQLLVALDAAIAELGGDRLARMLEDRLAELREQRDPVAMTAQNALAGPLEQDDLRDGRVRARPDRGGAPGADGRR